MDGSLEADGKTIASYDYNVDVTRKVVDMAHALGVTVEGELGCLGSLETMRGDKEDGHGTESTMTREQLLTDPEQAADFVKRTQLDALAIAIGTSHGAYKFTRKPTGDILAIDRIKEIHRRIPNTHLVMHGSSSVPQDLLAEIRQFGGDMKETYGVPVEEIQEAIKHGVRKINIDTDIRLAMTGAVRRYMAENPEQVRPARLPQAGARGGQEDLRAALPRVRLRRPGGEDQARQPAGRGQRLPQRQARADGGLSGRRRAPAAHFFLPLPDFSASCFAPEWPWWCLVRSASTPSSLRSSASELSQSCRVTSFSRAITSGASVSMASSRRASKLPGARLIEPMIARSSSASSILPCSFRCFSWCTLAPTSCMMRRPPTPSISLSFFRVCGGRAMMCTLHAARQRRAPGAR